jgi:hypothetical protein
VPGKGRRLWLGRCNAGERDHRHSFRQSCRARGGRSIERAELVVEIRLGAGAVFARRSNSELKLFELVEDALLVESRIGDSRTGVRHHNKSARGSRYQHQSSRMLTRAF